MKQQATEIKIGVQHEAKVLFERGMTVGGCYYLVIYGQHVNGYFCSVIDHFAVEMAEPSDTFYNSERLFAAGAPEWLANGIAKAIKFICEKMSPKKSPEEEAAEVEKKFDDIFNSAVAGGK